MLKHAVTLAALALPCGLRAQSTLDGWRYAIRTTIDSGNGRVMTTTARHYVTDHLIRVDVSITGVAGVRSRPEGDYSVTNTTDGTFLTVSAARRTALLSSAAPSAEILPRLPVYHTVASSMDEIELGPGEPVLGHDTRRFRVTTMSTIDTKLGAETCTGSRTLASELWIATDVDLGPVVAAELRGVAPTLGVRFDSVRRATPPVVSKLPNGTALRAITTTTDPDSAGMTRAVVATTEYLDLEHGPLEASLFTYRRGIGWSTCEAGISSRRCAALHSTRALRRTCAGRCTASRLRASFSERA